MGTLQSKDLSADLLGPCSTAEKLTDSDIEYLTRTQRDFATFHKEHSQELYDSFIENSDIFARGLGSKFKAWKWAVHDKWGLGHVTEQEELDYELLCDHLLDMKNMLTADDLDLLWTLFYATGDLVYPERVQSISDSEITHPITREVAQWSYESHVNQGLLEN